MKPQTLKRNLLDQLSPSDQTTFFKFGVGASIAPPFECVHHAFEFHAFSQPDAIAVEDFENKITYAELDRQANCLATYLRAQGVAPDSRLCFLSERSIPMVVGILGILKAGAAYVPLDGNIVSDSTLKHALIGSESKNVLVLKKFAHRVDGYRIICVEDIICATLDVSHCIKPEDLSQTNHGAYVIYTSGEPYTF